MKRTVVYIVIFFIICIFILNISEMTDIVIIKWYIEDLKVELNNKLNNNKKIKLKGTTLSIYLYETKIAFEYDEIYFNEILEKSQSNLFKNNNYIIKKVNNTLKIEKNNQNNKLTTIDTINKIEQILLKRKIITNIITIIIATLLYIAYKKQYKI
ncbi:hypothetical protein [Senegalia massiliensis]|uniref:Uncharacterized protein n=1 Tax=Senegalia massiliensis TaxID=1720316 RepID=A0A845QYH8_9CLOT|nr:hypothetical protein [Senegalia massiliensis]NBI07535.1 hypothetical protein [Senegalia massiliensis]